MPRGSRSLPPLRGGGTGVTSWGSSRFAVSCDQTPWADLRVRGSPPPAPLLSWVWGEQQEPDTPCSLPSQGGPGTPGRGPGAYRSCCFAVKRGTAGWAPAQTLCHPLPVQAGGDEVSLGGAGAPPDLGAVCFPSLLYVALLGCGAGPPWAAGGTRVPGPHCRSLGRGDGGGRALFFGGC